MIRILLLSCLLALPGCDRTEAALTPERPAPDGDFVWRAGSMTLRLTQMQRSHQETKDYLEEHGVPPARIYVASQGVVQRYGCWVRTIDGDVFTVGADGQEGILPKEWLERERT